MDSGEFREYLTGLRFDDRTIAYYTRYVQKADVWLQEHGSSVDTCKATQLREWGSMQPFSNSSRSQIVAALRHYWRFTERPNPPAGAIPVPTRPEMVCRTLEDDETRNLVKVALGWWPQGTAVLLGLYLALRRFEIAKAEWDRVDAGFEWYRVTGKRSKTATLPIHPVLRAELEPHQGAGWLFPGRYENRPVVPVTIGEWIEQVAVEAGVRNLTPHRLRHTSLTWAVDARIPLRDVQTFARHSDPGMTARYTRTTSRRLQEVVEALDYLTDDADDHYRLGFKEER